MELEPDVGSDVRLDVELGVGPEVGPEAVFESGAEPAAEGWLEVELKPGQLQTAWVLTSSSARDSDFQA